MSERNNASKSYGFRVTHQAKQRLLLRALDEMDTSRESREESAAVVEMIARLESLLAKVSRQRTLARAHPAMHRKRCTYGSRKQDAIATCEERNDHA